MEHFYTYIVRCKDNSLYIGHTDCLEKRIAEHNSGIYPGFTSKRRPVTLVYAVSFPSRDDAFAAERKMKKWSKAKKEALAVQDWDTVSKLAKKDFNH